MPSPTSPNRRSSLRLIFFALAFLCAVGIALQFVRPKLANPPVTAEVQVPPEVRAILRNSCYNCHSNETNLAWFDQIVPAYWKVAQDVRAARQHVNFSEIGSLPPAGQKNLLFEAVNEIQYGEMPLPSYKLAHPESAVTPEQLAVLRNYLASVSAQPMSAQSSPAAQTSAQAPAATPQTVSPAPNGIAYLPDYKNWKTISSSDRFDNNTIRAILGNDIAIKAIAENHINPWPDGAAFAKVAWIKQLDDKGLAHAGKFYQVEFMIRDSKQYARTLNWGFARWRGTDLKPYGKDATFVNECVDCHRPLRKNDSVFTMPIRGQQ